MYLKWKKITIFLTITLLKRFITYTWFSSTIAGKKFVVITSKKLKQTYFLELEKIKKKGKIKC